jgi:hypothetical protein
MKKKITEKPFDHSGSSFEAYLEEEGIRGEVEAVAIKRVLAWQLAEEMRRLSKTKKTMARELHTSRSQLDRLLDPHNVSVSLATMTRAAHVLGKSLTVHLGTRKTITKGRSYGGSTGEGARITKRRRNAV